MKGDFRLSGTLFAFHPVTDIFVTESIKCLFTSICMNSFCQNSYIDMFFIQNKYLGVPLYLILQVVWDTSFGRVGQHHIRRKIVNVRGKKR